VYAVFARGHRLRGDDGAISGTHDCVTLYLGARLRGGMCVEVCCSVLQCVAVCCSVLQCVVVCCSVLQCVAVCCSVLQCVAVCRSVLQCVAVCCSVLHTRSTGQECRTIRYLPDFKPRNGMPHILPASSISGSRPSPPFHVASESMETSKQKNIEAWKYLLCRCVLPHMALFKKFRTFGRKYEVTFAKEPHITSGSMAKAPV